MAAMRLVLELGGLAGGPMSGPWPVGQLGIDWSPDRYLTGAATGTAPAVPPVSQAGSYGRVTPLPLSSSMRFWNHEIARSVPIPSKRTRMTLE